MSIYRSFEQWTNGGFLEHGAPRTKEYTAEELHLVEMGWNYGYDAGRSVEQALNKMADNARELGLDYEPAPVQDGRDWSLLEATQESLREHMAEIKRLKAAQPVPVKTYHDGKPWPVAPKPWVGLSEKEVEAYDSWADFQVGCGRQTLFDMVRDIETRLKEKNT